MPWGHFFDLLVGDELYAWPALWSYPLIYENTWSVLWLGSYMCGRLCGPILSFMRTRHRLCGRVVF